MMLKISHIAPHVRASGNGICNVVVDLACLQAKAGFDVAVASEGGEYVELLTRYGARHFYLDKELRPIKILKSIIDYPALIKELQPNVIHVHTPRAVLLAGLFKRSFRYTLIGTMHSSNYGRNAKLMGWLASIQKWQEKALRNLERLTVERVCRETIAVYRELVPKNSNKLLRGF